MQRKDEPAAQAQPCNFFNKIHLNFSFGFTSALSELNLLYIEIDGIPGIHFEYFVQTQNLLPKNTCGFSET